MLYCMKTFMIIALNLNKCHNAKEILNNKYVNNYKSTFFSVHKLSTFLHKIVKHKIHAINLSTGLFIHT